MCPKAANHCTLFRVRYCFIILGNHFCLPGPYVSNSIPLIEDWVSIIRPSKFSKVVTMHIYGKNPFIFFCRTWLTTLLYSFGNVSKGAKIRNRYNQVPHLTQDTNGKVTNSQQDTTNDSQEVSPFPVGDHKANLGM